ncbi:hypothetical protein EDB85DRAFT_602914 [Lactarius pseudohatsudake]|nr:hypothetical protein EDB85DRAFT_602914 [Lactarius pseudohatsudake]
MATSSTVDTPVMSQIPTTAAASSRFQAIFQAALKSYQKQTKKDLLAHPLAPQLQSCDLTSAILALLQDQVREFDQAHSGDEGLTKRLIPTINVLYAFSAAVSEGASLVFSPAKVIFAGPNHGHILLRLPKTDGVFRRMLIPSETETTRSAGTATEKTKVVPLMRWWSTTICEPAQKPPDTLGPLATNPTIMSICVASAAELSQQTT